MVVYSMNKNMQKKLLFCVAMILLASCRNTAENNLLRHQDFIKEYKLLDDLEHILVSKSASQILSAAKNEESFVLYVGLSQCPWCQVSLPILNQIAKEKQIPEIWYWDITGFRGDGAQKKHRKEYLQILKLVGLEQPKNKLDKGIAGISRISTAFIAVINYGGIEIFGESPILLGEGKLILDSQGQTNFKNIRYQDGFMLNKEGQVIGAYMWDDKITGYQVPPKFKNYQEWLNRPEFTELLHQNLHILLNISLCGLCSHKHINF